MTAATKRRLLLLTGGACAYALTELGRFSYRPWVRATGVNDYGLAESVGSLGGVVVSLFIFLALFASRRRIPLGLAIGLGIGAVVYEFLQPRLGSGTFDWRDVLAIIIGFSLAFPAIWLVWRRFPDAPQVE